MAGTTVTNKKKTHEGKRDHFRRKSVTLDKRKKYKKKTEEDDEGRRRRRKGPGLPSVLRKELDLLNPNPELSEDDANSDEGGEEKAERNDLYEYDEPVPQEESQKNRRFDPIENLEYELPEDFKDENVPSSDDDEGGSEGKDGTDTSDELEVDAEENDDNKHLRMLQEITGMPGEAFQGKKRKKGISSTEFSPSEEALDGPITIHDLLDPLHGKPGYSKLRKRMYQLEKSSLALQAPLPKSEREKLERKAAYVQSKKDITKWEPLVKRNREAPTLFFDEDVNVGYSTVGAIASEFEPRTEFEKKISSILYDPEVMDAHKEDGARLLELNKISVEDIKDRQSRLAKMRSLLFRHEMKAKHIKKIKSKTYHRMLKRDRLKAASTEMEMDPEAAKELAMKQELKRAEERMTLKHKNSSKWAKRILKRGLKAQDESTRAAISEQLHLNTLLTRKMNSINDNSSSDESTASGEDDDLSSGSDAERPSKLLKRAKERTEKTLETIEHEDEMPKSGVLSLPFMVRGMKKRKEAAYEEAELALQEYDSQLRQLDDENGVENLKPGASSGRRVFGVTKSPAQEINNRIRSDNMDKDSDSEGDFEAKEKVDLAHLENTRSSKEVHVDPGILPDIFDAGHEAVFKSIDEIVGKPGLKSTYEVAIFASEPMKKLKNGKELDGCNKISSTVISSDIPHEHLQNEDQNSDTDSDVMVDGFISSGAKPDYELPSQADLIHRAFAGDDVEAEFEKDKMEILNEENPEPEKPIVLPGWGQWTDIQQKKGLPSWIVEEHKNAKKKREDALKKRKDARLKHVIISEKVDKKAEKLHSKTLPFPYTSKEVFEQSIRMPIGPEFNPATSVGALNRPAVVKKAGIIIKPIQFVEVDPHEKVEESKQVKKAPKASKTNKGGGLGRKGGKKTKELRT